MDKEFVSYEQALALKELGFRELSLACYDKCNMLSTYSKNVFEPLNYNNSGYVKSAPLKQQVFRWFREKYESYANLSSWLHEEEIGTYHEFDIYGANQYAHGSVPFKTYEEAENACIDKLIEIAKQQDNG
jgi:hypothetical protein